VIHFAAFKSVGESMTDPEKYYDNNINSLLVLLEVMQENKVHDLVFSSSCTVYGQPDEIPVTEKTELKKPSSPYGETKVICEQKLLEFHRLQNEFKIVILRYFNPIGAHPSGLIGELPLGVPTNLVPFITQTAAGWREKLTINGNDYATADGTCVRDYIHVVDLSLAHVAALDWISLQKNAFSPEIFNLGTGRGYTILEVIKAFEKGNGLSLPYEFGPRREGDVEKIYASTQKANEMLQWKTRFSLEEAMQHAWKWQQTLKEKVN
jgi:UDP-glucose 4-epimerase